jgi:glycosyltransferase involved in cell wall biosynthesis
MLWLLFSLLITVLLELIIIQIKNDNIRRTIAAIPIIYVGLISIFILYAEFQVWTIVLAYFSVFRIINFSRVVHGQKQKDFLKNSTKRSSLVLVAFQILVILCASLLNLITTSYHLKWGILIAFEVAAVMVVALSLRNGLKKARPKITNKFIEDSALPSITVAIPARNETVSLEKCLENLIASDYPKLEILVLDDCSQEKRTPEIIRQFAHDGVRFLAGSVPGDAWSPKNYAYQQLLEEASGELIVYCGVDALFDKQCLRKIVELKIHKHKTMLSFMPFNSLPKERFKRLLIQPMRYLWELGLPRDYSKRPPTLSTCWIADREFLHSHGGFKAVSREIIPERYFARIAEKHDSGYSFIAIGQGLGLSSNKSFSEQHDTALRTRYPTYRQRLENVSLFCLVEAVIFILPIILLVYEIIYSSLFLVVLLLVNIIVSSLIFKAISRQTYSLNLSLSYVIYPFVFIYDIYISFYSMFLYEFSEVIWKGRNVCIPVMQVIPSLDSERIQ